jgi:hypothetical protein
VLHDALLEAFPKSYPIYVRLAEEEARRDAKSFPNYYVAGRVTHAPQETSAHDSWYVLFSPRDFSRMRTKWMSLPQTERRRLIDTEPSVGGFVMVAPKSELTRYPHAYRMDIITYVATGREPSRDCGCRHARSRRRARPQRSSVAARDSRPPRTQASQALALIKNHPSFHRDERTRELVEQRFWGAQPPEVRRAAHLLIKGWAGSSTGDSGLALAAALREAGIIKHQAPHALDSKGDIDRFAASHGLRRESVIAAVRAQYAYTQAYFASRPRYPQKIATVRVLGKVYASKGQVGYDRTIVSASSAYHLKYSTTGSRPLTYAEADVDVRDVYAPHHTSRELRRQSEREAVVMYSPRTKSHLKEWTPKARAAAERARPAAVNVRSGGLDIFEDW